MVGRSSREIVLTGRLLVQSRERVKYFSPQTQIGHFVKEGQFFESLQKENDTVRDFFDIEKNPSLPLLLGIPFGQFSDLDLGQGKLPQDMIQRMVKAMNDEEDE